MGANTKTILRWAFFNVLQGWLIYVAIWQQNSGATNIILCIVWLRLVFAIIYQLADSPTFREKVHSDMLVPPWLSSGLLVAMSVCFLAAGWYFSGLSTLLAANIFYSIKRTAMQEKAAGLKADVPDSAGAIIDVEVMPADDMPEPPRPWSEICHSRPRKKSP